MIYPKLIAHRGLFNDNYPENSLSAFKNAVLNGIAIELDVRLTKDCKIVVFHDSDLNRMTGIDAELSDFTYEQLSILNLSNTNEHIPTLSQVLKLVDGKVPIFIEIKGGAPIGTLEKRLDKLMKSYKGSWSVMSFNPFRLMWFNRHASHVTRGQLVSCFKKKMSLKYISRKICSKPTVWKYISKPNFIAYDLRCIGVKPIIDAFENNCEFLTWTASNEELLTQALKFSKSVIFDNIDPNIAKSIAENEE
ncbi:MAG: glycerophosphodiester phosphodiesterase [Clostridiales bacterium]|nr:glycerophosphodiester phosphodiesterase [Clostridiales bacterium]